DFELPNLGRVLLAGSIVQPAPQFFLRQEQFGGASSWSLRSVRSQESSLGPPSCQQYASARLPGFLRNNAFFHVAALVPKLGLESKGENRNSLNLGERSHCK